MPNVVDGTVVEYAREDAGGSVHWDGPNGALSGWIWAPGEQVVAGKDVPVEICRRSVEDGICRIAGSADAPKTVSKSMQRRMALTKADKANPPAAPVDPAPQIDPSDAAKSEAAAP